MAITLFVRAIILPNIKGKWQIKFLYVFGFNEQSVVFYVMWYMILRLLSNIWWCRQNIKQRLRLVEFFCSPIICPLAIMSKVTASSRNIVTIFQLYIALHSICAECQFFLTRWTMSFLSLAMDWLSVVDANARAVAAAAAPIVVLSRLPVLQERFYI